MKWNDIKLCVGHCSHTTQRAFETTKRETEDIRVEVSHKNHRYQALFAAYLGQGHGVYVTIIREAKHRYTISTESADGKRMPGFNGDSLKEIGKSFIRAVRKHGVTG